MKKNILILFILMICGTSYSQQYYMNGRFSNTTPDLSLGIDSAIFVFTSTNYSYYINNGPNPLSFGTYWVITGGASDTLMLMEDSLGVCSGNGTGATVKMEIDYTFLPYQSIILSETTQSMDSCATHSAKMRGDFIAQGGTITTVSTSVKETGSASTLQAHVYNNQLRLTGSYNEKVSVTVTNISGQK